MTTFSYSFPSAFGPSVPGNTNMSTMPIILKTLNRKQKDMKEGNFVCCLLAVNFTSKSIYPGAATILH